MWFFWPWDSRFKLLLFIIILSPGNPFNNSADASPPCVTLCATWDLNVYFRHLQGSRRAFPPHRLNLDVYRQKCFIVGSNLCRFFLQSSLLILRLHQFLFGQQQLFIQGVCLLLRLTHTHTKTHKTKWPNVYEVIESKTCSTFILVFSLKSLFSRKVKQRCTQTCNPFLHTHSL